MVRVNEREIEYKKGMTVADAIREAGQSIDKMTIVIVDGIVLSLDEIKSVIVEDGAFIKLLPLISGG
ncbi:MAG: MoaD/ThiS family protein [Tissierellia bacterium]|nr:MoaD/ThiS family protein [Tissierellia bacterium]